jgi:hypothetical protein
MTQNLNDNYYEWVELYNPTNQSINLTGLSITDNSAEDFFIYLIRFLNIFIQYFVIIIHHITRRKITCYKFVAR